MRLNGSRSIKKFVYISVLTALAAGLTIYPQIPTGTGGFVHFGDSIIYITSIFFGGVAGMLVGGIGHSIADILSGHAEFALPTLIIKSIMGIAVGFISNGNHRGIRLYTAFLSGGLIITFGYFFAEIPMFGLEPAKIVFISSPVQWVMSIAATFLMLPIIKKIINYT